MTLDLNKIKAAALVSNGEPMLIPANEVHELITRLEAAERELNLLKPNPLCDVGCMLSCSMEGAARLEAAEKDAARYRWLRDANISGYKLHQTISDDCNPPYQEFKYGTGLDEAIDAAMKESEK